MVVVCATKETKSMIVMNRKNQRREETTLKSREKRANTTPVLKESDFTPTEHMQRVTRFSVR